MKKQSIVLRLLLLLLAAAMLTASLAACGGNKKPVDPDAPADNGTTVGNGGEEVTTSPYPYPVETFGTATAPARFQIAARSERSDYLWVDEKNASTVMDRAVVARNRYIEDQFNVEIILQECGHSNGTEFIRRLEAEYMGQLGAWDVVCPAYWWGTTAQGYYLNLANFEEIDLADDWWIEGYNENAGFAGYQPSILGNAQFDTFYNLLCVFYNKNIAGNIHLDPYPYIDGTSEDGRKWTLEVVDEFGRLARQDPDGNGISTVNDGNGISGVKDANDVIGSLINASMVDPAFAALGLNCARRNGGMVELNYGDVHNIDIYDKFYDFANNGDKDYNVTLTGDAHSCLADVSTAPFENGKVLFLWQAFRVGGRILQSGVNYGIVPAPMLDDEQDHFITAPYDLTQFCLMKTTPSPHKSAVVLNALNAVSWEMLGTPYFDVFLGLRVSKDENSSRMIPIIRDSIYCDFSFVNFGALSHNLIGNFSDSLMYARGAITPTIQKYEGICNDSLNELREKWVEYRDRDDQDR